MRPSFSCDADAAIPFAHRTASHLDLATDADKARLPVVDSLAERTARTARTRGRRCQCHSTHGHAQDRNNRPGRRATSASTRSTRPRLTNVLGGWWPTRCAPRLRTQPAEAAAPRRRARRGHAAARRIISRWRNEAMRFRSAAQPSSSCSSFDRCADAEVKDDVMAARSERQRPQKAFRRIRH
jgi:hypothetical protein